MVLHEQQRCLRRVDGRAALRLGGREDAVRRHDGVRGPERRAARACVVIAAIRVDVVARGDGCCVKLARACRVMQDWHRPLIMIIAKQDAAKHQSPTAQRRRQKIMREQGCWL